MSEKTKEMKEQLFYRKKSAYEVEGEAGIAKAYEFARGYADFIGKAKTEREAVTEGINILKAHGFSEYQLGDKVKAGDKLY